jgi:hypothetical protein
VPSLYCSYPACLLRQLRPVLAITVHPAFTPRDAGCYTTKWVVTIQAICAILMRVRYACGRCAQLLFADVDIDGDSDNSDDNNADIVNTQPLLLLLLFFNKCM